MKWSGFTYFSDGKYDYLQVKSLLTDIQLPVLSISSHCSSECYQLSSKRNIYGDILLLENLSTVLNFQSRKLKILNIAHLFLIYLSKFFCHFHTTSSSYTGQSLFIDCCFMLPCLWNYLFPLSFFSFVKLLLTFQHLTKMTFHIGNISHKCSSLCISEKSLLHLIMKEQLLKSMNSCTLTLISLFVVDILKTHCYLSQIQFLDSIPYMLTEYQIYVLDTVLFLRLGLWLFQQLNVYATGC